MRHLVVLLVATTLICAAGLSSADDERPALVNPSLDPGAGSKSGDDAVDPQSLKRPEDFAPAERVIVGRDPRAFRKTGSLLSVAAGEVPKVDPYELAARREAMAEGRRFTTSLRYPESTQPIRPDAAPVNAAASQPVIGSWGFFVLAMVMVGLGGLCLAIRKGLLDREQPEPIEQRVSARPQGNDPQRRPGAIRRGVEQ